MGIHYERFHKMKLIKRSSESRMSLEVVTCDSEEKLSKLSKHESTGGPRLD